MAMSEIRVGTSGYSYSWNKGKPTPFKWYCKQGFPTVEVNASFYRFPMTSWIKTWQRCPPGFDFTIKVHRSITHYKKLQRNTIKTWNKFRSGFKDMEDKITFWLFQMPPSFTATQQNINRILAFFQELNLDNSAVIEFRDSSWWDKKEICKEIGCTFCSVDAPDLPKEIVTMNNAVYVRLHGREAWYRSVYSDAELNKIIEQVGELGASKKYIYLNNNHGMLPNGKYLMEHL